MLAHLLYSFNIHTIVIMLIQCTHLCVCVCYKCTKFRLVDQFFLIPLIQETHSIKINLFYLIKPALILQMMTINTYHIVFFSPNKMWANICFPIESVYWYGENYIFRVVHASDIHISEIMVVRSRSRNVVWTECGCSLQCLSKYDRHIFSSFCFGVIGVFRYLLQLNRAGKSDK